MSLTYSFKTRMRCRIPDRKRIARRPNKKGVPKTSHSSYTPKGREAPTGNKKKLESQRSMDTPFNDFHVLGALFETLLIVYFR